MARLNVPALTTGAAWEFRLTFLAVTGVMTPDPDDELVGWLDADGRVIGTVPRQRMRRERLPHRCVYLLVFNSRRELFIHQRTATMVFRAVHNGPFRLQPEELVLASFISTDELSERVFRERLGPDGLAVWAEYCGRVPGSEVCRIGAETECQGRCLFAAMRTGGGGRHPPSPAAAPAPI